MAVPVAFFVVFFAYPVAAIVRRGLHTDGAWHLGRIADVLGQDWEPAWGAAANLKAAS